MSLPPIFTPEYYDYMRRLEEVSWWNAGMRDVASMLLDHAGLPERGTLIDVGCGSGQGMKWFTMTRPEWRVIGLDLGLEGLRAARKSGFRHLTQASATDLPHSDGSADLVITLDVLQHLPLEGGDRQALGEMRRVLRPGGLLFARTNCQAFPRRPDDQEAVWHKYEVGELREKLEAAGFRILRLSKLNALLGLAEIPRELKRGEDGVHSSYDLVRSTPRSQGRWSSALKRAWLRFEGRAVRRGFRWPTGRSIIALCEADSSDRTR